MRHALVALVVLVVGCGGVTVSPLEHEGGVADGVADSAFPSDHAQPVAADSGLNDAGPDVEAPPSCSSSARCAACAPYPCEAVLACVRSGDGGTYPWLNCSNMIAGVGASAADMNCTMRAACP